MIKKLVIVIGCFALMAGAVSAQEVVIPDFPLGVAGSIDVKIFEPYLEQFQAIADTLKLDPMIRAVVTGGADGQKYRSSHDAKNPSLALGRAHTLRSFLMDDFDIDSTQIEIRTKEFKEIGPEYRYVGVRIEKYEPKSDPYTDQKIAGLVARIDSLEDRPPVEKHFTEIKEMPVEDAESDLGIEFGIGVSSSPFGGLPVLTTAFTYKRVVYVEGLFGHTWWGNEFQWVRQDLDPVEILDLKTRRRLIGGHVIIYPWEDIPLGFVGGWLRVEEIAQEFYEYSKLSEGPLVGVRFQPLKNIAVTAAYNPSKHRDANLETSTSENDQFLIYLTGHWGIGGAR